MMILKESLYGWGVCDIPMPRAAYDIYSDRRKRKVRLFCPDRRKPVARQSLVSDMSGILIRDVPYRQFFFAKLSFSLLFCIYLYVEQGNARAIRKGRPQINRYNDQND